MNRSRSTLRSWGVRLLSLFRKRRLDRRLDEELRFHLEMQARDNEARGMSPEAARRAARLAFAAGGSLEPLKEEYRARRGLPALETLAQDLRYALRMMRKSPGFTAVALLSLAFGIGTNSAIFSVVDALLLKTLPVPDADRLAILQRVENRERVPYFSYFAYRQLSDSASVCAAVMAATHRFPVVVKPPAGARTPGSVGGRLEGGAGGGAAGGAGGGAAGGADGGTVETAYADLVSGNLFTGLGVGAAAGRTFTAAEDGVPGGHLVAVLGYGYWQRRFGRDPGVIGQTISLNGAPVTVVGVAPSGFQGVFVDEAPDVFLPMTLRDRVKYHSNTFTDGREDLTQPVWNQVNVAWLQLLARRRPGVSLAQARAVLGVLFQRTREAQLATHPDPETRRILEAQTLLLEPGARGKGSWREELTPPLLILSGAAGLVLLIACANVANLLLARADRRRKEMAVRLGIGAGRRRLLRQLLTESLLLAGLGSALGLLFAVWGSRMLLRLVSVGTTPVALDVALDWRKLAFAFAVAAATGVGFGLVPALQATRVDLAASLKEGGRSALATGAAGGGARRGGRGRLPLGRALVAAQIGLSLLLLIGAGLFVRSLQNLMHVDTGLTRDRLVLATINPRLLGYDEARLIPLYDRLVERLEALPGVRAASLSVFLPLSSSMSVTSVELPGSTPPPGKPRLAHIDAVTAHFFAATGIPLLAGRGFEARDRQGAPRVAIVNDTLAHGFFPRRSALGQRFGFEADAPRQFEIVGVVRDAKYNRLGEKTPAMIYLPVSQGGASDLRVLEVREVSAAGAPAAGSPAGGGAGAGGIAGLRRAVAEVEPNLPVLQTATLREQVDHSLARERAVARLTGFFGVLALLLSAIGLYGVMSYSVARRTGEIGLRMALGAARGSVLALILRETARMVAIGVAAGLAAALATTRLAASQLFGLGAQDPATLATATLVLVAVALLAGFLPARRAAVTAPMEALRYE
jgi:predicted permease